MQTAKKAPLVTAGRSVRRVKLNKTSDLEGEGGAKRPIERGVIITTAKVCITIDNGGGNGKEFVEGYFVVAFNQPGVAGIAIYFW